MHAPQLLGQQCLFLTHSGVSIIIPHAIQANLQIHSRQEQKHPFLCVKTDYGKATQFWWNWKSQSHKGEYKLKIGSEECSPIMHKALSTETHTHATKSNIAYYVWMSIISKTQTHAYVILHSVLRSTFCCVLVEKERPCKAHQCHL